MASSLFSAIIGQRALRRAHNVLTPNGNELSSGGRRPCDRPSVGVISVGLGDRFARPHERAHEGPVESRCVQGRHEISNDGPPTRHRHDVVLLVDLGPLDVNVAEPRLGQLGTVVLFQDAR